MPLDLKLSIYDASSVAAIFSRIKIFRSDTQNGVYAEITTPDTRPVISSSQTVYEYIDPNGSSSQWYASSYFSPQTLAESSRSAPQQGSGDTALGIISVQDLKQNYLFGLRLQDRKGNPIPDSVYETGIRTGLAWVQRKLGFLITPTVFTDERHDYRSNTSKEYLFTQVDNLPLQSVQAFRLVFPGSTSEPHSIDLKWITTSQWDGGIEVVPSAFGGSFGGLGFPGLFFGGGSNWRDYVPGVIRIDYTAGFLPGTMPADILDLVAKAAAMHPLAIAGDLAQPFGVSSSSISIDGLGQSIGRTASQTGNAYASRMNAYLLQMQTDLPMLRSAYRACQMRVI
jgi:hypothetical protein